jgi:broad specificity phosphatase PhoE
LGVWHSPLGRAARTAGAIAGAIGASTPVHERDQLKELDQGAWEGLHRTEIEARYGRRLAAWRRDPTRYHATGGESLAAGARRVSLIAGEVNAALSAAGAAPPAPTTGHAVRSPVLHAGSSPDGWPWAVVVAHDGVLRLLTLYLLGLPRTAYWSLPFALCGITIVELVDGRGRLRAHNLTEHLAGAAASTAKPRPEGAL